MCVSCRDQSWQIPWSWRYAVLWVIWHPLILTTKLRSSATAVQFLITEPGLQHGIFLHLTMRLIEVLIQKRKVPRRSGKRTWRRRGWAGDTEGQLVVRATHWRWLATRQSDTLDTRAVQFWYADSILQTGDCFLGKENVAALSMLNVGPCDIHFLLGTHMLMFCILPRPVTPHCQINKSTSQTARLIHKA